MASACPKNTELKHYTQAGVNFLFDKFRLSQNYPNPYNPSAKIRIDVKTDVTNQGSNVTLLVYDILGNEVATFVNETLSSGSYEVDLNTADQPGGAYFYRMNSGNSTETKKLILVK